MVDIKKPKSGITKKSADEKFEVIGTSVIDNQSVDLRWEKQDWRPQTALVVTGDPYEVTEPWGSKEFKYETYFTLWFSDRPETPWEKEVKLLNSDKKIIYLSDVALNKKHIDEHDLGSISHDIVKSLRKKDYIPVIEKSEERKERTTKKFVKDLIDDIIDGMSDLKLPEYSKNKSEDDTLSRIKSLAGIKNENL